MKKILLLIVAFVFTFSMTAFAAEKAADTKTPEVTKSDVKKTDGKKRHHKKHYLRGEVKAVDAQAGSITIAGKKGEKTLAANPDILKNIQVGDKVFVKVKKQDGKLTATSVKTAKEVKEKRAARKAAKEKKAADEKK